jgi:hypothetical protein
MRKQAHPIVCLLPKYPKYHYLAIRLEIKHPERPVITGSSAYRRMDSSA